MDQKMEKFKALAEKRVQNALKAIYLIGALSKRSSYHYTENHVEQIFSALEKALEAERRKFVLELEGKPGNFLFSLVTESEESKNIPANEIAEESEPE